ncbi:putative F420-dependent oxidoreductase [Haloactinospora alba]|uniref:Putative F420-dependent oxidoreductase n=1 Tax=Haloactinospora alba TaxID=405555 RepID=A0A543NNK1_9ACTN|nr:LLM class F420-dependent oxidoreductase [Haloactinospora alba]TQN33410.1 putative F420-dependent oxidoreductase [Haloactinospora alba]
MSTFITDEGIAPAELGPALEQRGLDALFTAEHSHIPVTREVGAEELERRYYRTLDPFVALSAAAAATRRLVVGTGIALLVQRDPIMVAKEAASLDRVSDGRFVLGVGSGWGREEMRHHGTDPRTRVSLLGERVRAIKRIWTSDVAEFHGDFVDFDPMYAWPKPVQQPHLPVLVGGEAPTVLDRVLDYGDGWFPRWNGETEPLASRIAELRERGQQQGRGRLPVTVFGVPANPTDITAAAGLDVERILIDLPTMPRNETLAYLDSVATMVTGLD